MSIIEAVQTYIKEYEGLESGAPVWIDYLSSVPVEYSIQSTPGRRILEEDVVGNSTRVFPFVLQAVVATADDAVRLDNLGFFEEFADWLETQTELGDLPELGDDKTAVRIEATGWGFLFEQGNSDTGIAQITCQLVYEQETQEWLKSNGS